MNRLKFMSAVFLFTILSLKCLQGEVKLYSDGECLRILFDNLREDMASAYIKNAFGSKIKEDYDCWNKSEVRLKTIGKRIDENRLMDLVEWILLGDIENDFYTLRRMIGVNIEPTEHYPCQLIPIYKEHEGKPLLCVGTERGFIGAALSKASRLYLVDYTPDIAVYNYIVTLLLKASDNQERYLYLRKEATCEEWGEAFSSKNINVKGDLQHSVAVLWKFWNKNVRFRRGFSKSIERQISPVEVDSTEVIPLSYPSDTKFIVNLQGFANANYLFDEDLFQWVKHLADQDRILIYLADVSDNEQLKELLSDIYPEKFGMIDLSNIIALDEKDQSFKSPYLDALGHQNCFSALCGAANEKTCLVWISSKSVVANDCLEQLKKIKLERGIWTYRAVPLFEALYFSLRESSKLDIWRSELTLFEGCRVSGEYSTITDSINNLFY